MTDVLTDTITLPFIAERVGASNVTVSRWARQWHGHAGKGYRRTYTVADLLVARAWFDLCGREPGPLSAETRHRRALAEAAIRCAPQRYLVMGADGANTYSDRKQAVKAWVATQRCPGVVGRFVDLLPEEPA